MLGRPGDWLRIAQKRLGPGRIHHVMRWLGQMQRAFEPMCRYALEREAFGGPLADKQTVQNWIADSAAEIQACRLLTLDAARKLDEGGEARVEVSLIKFYAARVLHDVIDRAIQVHGARGLTDETPLGTMYAMARGAQIYDGPDEVLDGRQSAASSRRSPTAAPSRSRNAVVARTFEELSRDCPLRERGLDRVRQLGRLEAERADLALEGDAAVPADQVEPVGPAAVRRRDRVVDVVEQDRDPRPQAAAREPPRCRALIQRGRSRARSPRAGCRRAPSRPRDAPRGCRR